MIKKNFFKKFMKFKKKSGVVEEKIASQYSKNKMRCPTHLSIGQEAVAASSGLALQK